MDIYEYGNPDSSTVLLQMVDDHDLAVIENEVAAVRKTADDFRLLAVKVKNWNLDLSPWNAPAVFGKEGFGGGAAETLDAVLDLCSDGSRQYYVGGYSLAGLFALWAAYQTDVFAGVAAASPSVWFPGFADYRIRRGGGGVAFGLVSRFCGLHGRACDKMQASLSESGGQGRKGAESGDGCCGREYSQGV